MQLRSASYFTFRILFIFFLAHKLQVDLTEERQDQFMDKKSSVGVFNATSLKSLNLSFTDPTTEGAYNKGRIISDI